MFNASRIDEICTPLIGNGFEFDMLRDDLIHPIISGNKWRKLKYIVKDVKDRNHETLVTFGGAFSNHLVATACAGHAFGIKTVGFVRGEEIRNPSHYEVKCIEFGMELIHVPRDEYRDKRSLFESRFGNDSSAYFVNEGGDHPLALPGCAEILDELDKTYDYILLSLGTGTTMEGLVKEIDKRGLTTKVLGISSLKNNFDLDKKLLPYDSSRYEIHHDFHRGKYAKSDAELIQFIHRFHEDTGIKTDIVYTGKMLMAFDALIRLGSIKQGSKVLCIHTGGLMAFPEPASQK